MHKIFNYYHENQCHNHLASNVSDSLKEVYDGTRQNHYRSSGKYKGDPVCGALFSFNIKTIDVKKADTFDLMLDLIICIRDETDYNKVVFKHAIQLYQFAMSNDMEDEELINFYEDRSDGNFPSFEGILSQDRAFINNTLE